MDFLDIKEFIIDSIKLIFFIIVVLLIAIYVIGFQQIVGSSMKPTLNNQDIVLLDKLSYRFKNVKRGDIISFYYADSKFLVKRVIGLPGESIEYVNGGLFVDGSKVDEPYLNNIVTEDFSFSKITDDMFFVLGDNRSDSLDSRDEKVGLIQKSDIIGKAIFRIWPLNKIGFMKKK